MANVCKAKNPTVCPYHRNVYGFANPQKISARLDDLYHKIAATAEAIDPTVIKQRQHLEKLYAQNKILLDSTPEGVASIQKKLQEADPESLNYLKLQSRKDKVKELFNIRNSSEERLKTIRSNIEKQLFGSKNGKIASLCNAIDQEILFLEEERERNAFFVKDNRRVIIESAYNVAQTELLDFKKSLSNSETSTSDARATFAVDRVNKLSAATLY